MGVGSMLAGLGVGLSQYQHEEQLRELELDIASRKQLMDYYLSMTEREDVPESVKQVYANAFSAVAATPPTKKIPKEVADASQVARLALQKAVMAKENIRPLLSAMGSPPPSGPPTMFYSPEEQGATAFNEAQKRARAAQAAAEFDYARGAPFSVVPQGAGGVASFPKPPDPYVKVGAGNEIVVPERGPDGRLTFKRAYRAEPEYKVSRVDDIQLIDGGNVTGKLIGGTWYVENEAGEDVRVPPSWVASSRPTRSRIEYRRVEDPITGEVSWKPIIIEPGPVKLSPLGRSLIRSSTSSGVPQSTQGAPEGASGQGAQAVPEGVPPPPRPRSGPYGGPSGGTPPRPAEAPAPSAAAPLYPGGFAGPLPPGSGYETAPSPPATLPGAPPSPPPSPVSAGAFPMSTGPPRTQSQLAQETRDERIIRMTADRVAKGEEGFSMDKLKSHEIYTRVLEELDRRGTILYSDKDREFIGAMTNAFENQIPLLEELLEDVEKGSASESLAAASSLVAAARTMGAGLARAGGEAGGRLAEGDIERALALLPQSSGALIAAAKFWPEWFRDRLELMKRLLNNTMDTVINSKYTPYKAPGYGEEEDLSGTGFEDKPFVPGQTIQRRP